MPVRSYLRYFEPIRHARADEAEAKGMTVELLLALEKAQAEALKNQGVIIADKGDAYQNKMAAIKGNPEELQRQEEGKQKAYAEAGKAANAMLGLTMPSGWWNLTHLDNKLTEGQATAMDLGAMVLLGGAGLTKGAISRKTLEQNFFENRVAELIARKNTRKTAESHNLFQADVYRGGKEGNWYTTDKKYASQYGPVSKYKIEAKKVYDPEEPLIFHQKPSKLTEAERLGIPKGERNNILFRPHDYGNLRFIKNYSGIPIMENGKIRISPQENLLANVTTDVPFRLHKDYPKMPGSEYLIIDPKGLRGKTPLSIEPSDTFFPNDDLLIDPQYVRVLTGNKKIIPELEKLGLQVETSPELQNIYEQIMASQEKPSLLSKTDFGSQNGIDLYREAIDKYITDVIGRPSLKDYIHLEKLTGLNAGVELNIGQFNKYFLLFDDVNNGKITLLNIPDPAWVFPNKRELNISHFIPRHGVSSYQSRLKIPYKEVYYDPTSYIESDITAQLNGMSSHPTYERYGEQGIQAIKEYILKHHLRPLRQQGGKLNYAKFYK